MAKKHALPDGKIPEGLVPADGIGQLRSGRGGALQQNLTSVCVSMGKIPKSDVELVRAEIPARIDNYAGIDMLAALCAIPPPAHMRHPAAQEARDALKAITKDELQQLQDFFLSSGKENKLGMVCAETLRCLVQEKSVSDEELLGLMWAIFTSPPDVSAAIKMDS